MIVSGEICRHPLVPKLQLGNGLPAKLRLRVTSPDGKQELPEQCVPKLELGNEEERG
jgi:hypothetical protein